MIAADVTAGDVLIDYGGTVVEVVATWSDTQTGLEYIMVLLGLEQYELTLEVDELVRVRF